MTKDQEESLAMEDLFPLGTTAAPSVDAKCAKKKVNSLMEQFEDEKNYYLWKLKKFGFFHYACKQGETDVVQHLIHQGEDVNLTTVDGATPLFSACSEGHKEVVELLIQHGSDVNTTATSGYHKGLNALYWACFRGHVEVVELLLKNGADPNVSDPHGWTALMDASREGHETVVNLLLQYRASFNASIVKGEYEGWTPLYFANGEGHLGVVRVLMENGSDIIRDKDTPVETGTQEAVSAQLNGARVSTTSSPSRN